MNEHSSHTDKGDRHLPPGASLRHWLDYLQQSGRLKVACTGVSLHHEIAAIANRLDGSAATLFPRPEGHDVSVISGLLSDRSWMAEAMGVEPKDVLARFECASEMPIPCLHVDNPECQQVVHRDVDILSLLPIPMHNAHDSGPYITAGLLITRNPATGEQNVSIHRLQVSSRNRLGVLLLPRHTMALFQQEETKGNDLDVAIVIGNDPMTLMASQAIVPLGQNELEIAGALQGRPLPVARCLTNDVEVPAESEIVLEGRILAYTVEPEGPFGEFPQYYGERAERHVIEIEAITHRENPLFHTIVGGGLEHLLLGGIPREATMLAHLRRNFSCIRDVHLSLGGVCRYHLYIQVDKHSEGEAKNIIMCALGGHYDIKHVVVVDDDVDIHVPSEVEWAVATRFQASRDLVIIHDAQGSRLDPSTRSGVGSKLGFDATVPIDAPAMRFQRIHVPGENEIVLDKVLMNDVVPWRKINHSD